jgi:hypothetical protein
MTTTTTTNHAAANAAAWCATILDQMARLKVACRESGIDEGIYETIREEIQESPLSLQIRSDWSDLGSALEPAELCILLSTGGPALRIVGTLGRFNCPEDCRLEYQDWGTPWTEYRGIGSAVLDSWAAQFYWGD